MAPRGIPFLTPETVTEVGEAELGPLRDELLKIADGSPRLEAAAALAEKLDTLIVPLGGDARTFEPDPGERFALLRALDHLRNLDQAEKSLLELRGRLCGTGSVDAIGYQLRYLNARPAQGFASYSLAYEIGDRLVTPQLEELRVLGVEEGDPAILDVGDWRPA